MADISLRDYLTKLDTLLKSGSAAEVILHCRHILQYFPKDAQAYRLLGQALVATSRWQEAGEVMRRVLSVFPDDREAHAGLSEVYRIEKRPDDAIWHLERAFEQTPNDPTILENLRELYRKYHKTEHGKVQLTAGAVARQYMRNGLYEQAIDTLQMARAASPERIDLPLLLAQTYWDRGQRVEAAETALEVLKVLPDCLVANTLLAAMWLTEARPSDAQRYIGRIESLDPYLALELAQGQDVPDNAFKLPELDYELAAQREINSQTPDWLGMTGSSDMQAPAEDDIDINEVPDFFNDITANEDIMAKQSFDVPLTSEDWGNIPNDLPSVTDDSSPTIRKPTGSLTGLSERFGKTDTGSLPTDAAPKSNVPGAKRGLTGRLTPPPQEIPEPEPISTDFFSSFMDDVDAASTEEVASPDETGNIYTGDLPDLASLVPEDSPDEDLPFRRERAVQADDNDPLAWLRSSGVEIDEEAPARSNDEDVYDAESDNFALQEADAADPLSWLQGYGGNDMVVEQDETKSVRATSELPIPEDQAGDPLAWLQTTESSDQIPTTSSDEASAQSSSEDPLDWLSDDSLLDEAFDLESLVNDQSPMPEQSSFETDVSSTAATPEWQDTMADEKDPLDWLSSEPESEPEAEPTDSFTWMEDAQPTDAVSSEDFPDWLNASESSSEIVDGAGVGSGDDLGWMTDLPDMVADDPAEAQQSGTTGMLDWLGKEKSDAPDMPAMELPDNDAPDWLGELNTDTPSNNPVSNVDENGFEWMSTADELPPVPSTSDVPDWLSGMDINAEADDEPEPLAAADTPDWLSSMEPDADETEAEPLAAADTPDWLSSMEPDADEAEAEPLAAADTPDWLSSMEPDADETEAEPLAAADTPDWLSSMEPDVDETEAEPLAAADTPDWLSSMEPDADEAEPEPLAAADTPDWLSSMEPDADEEEAEPLAAADTPDWLSSMEPDADEEEAEPLAAADTPDWLSSMEPDADETEAEPLAADTPDWLSSMEPDADETEAEPLAAADTPDWLSSMEPDADEEEAEPLAAADTPDWLSSMEPDADEAEAEPLAAADTPDWLSSMEPDADEAEPEPLAAADTPDWLSSMEQDADEPEAEPLAAADTPDWLSSMEQDADEAEEADEPAAIVDTPDWLSSMDIGSDSKVEAEPEPIVTDTPDWLSAMQPDDEPEAESEPLAAADTPDWLSAMQPEDEPEPLGIADTPDWLSAMQPDDEPEAVVSEDQNAEVKATDMSNWLDDMPEPELDTAQPMNDEEWSEAAELAPEMTADVPDWLTAMNSTSNDAPTNGENNDDYQWDDASQEESMPAAPAPASNAPDWLNAMVPGLDVDYDAPEDEQVETEFLPTNREATPLEPTKETKVRPEFGWLLDIVSEESQQVTVVADKTALRRFVFSKLPTWLRKPTEQPDKSPAGESEADNVDIPPWLQ